jgi:hypothetical protein
MITYLEKKAYSKYIRYRCGTCDELHQDPYDAQSCCEPDQVLVCPVCNEQHFSVESFTNCHGGAAGISARTCPVCHSMHDTTDEAVDCCQWKTMGFGDRYRLARQLEQTIF